MAYRKLGVDNKHRKSMLSNLTREILMKEEIKTTEARAKEARKFVDKMITYGKRGDLTSRRKALAFLRNDKEVVNKIFNDLAKRILSEDFQQGYLTISNALQWRLQYSRVISLENKIDGVTNYEW